MSKKNGSAKKEYEIQGKKLIQTPLTVGQVKAIMKAFGSFELKPQTTMSEVVDFVLDGKLQELFEVVFRGQDLKGIEFDDIPYDTVDEVVEDFLSLNPKLTGRLKQLFSSLGAVAKAVTTG